MSPTNESAEPGKPGDGTGRGRDSLTEEQGASSQQLCLMWSSPTQLGRSVSADTAQPCSVQGLVLCLEESI